jgi:hypothetical protein
VALHSMRRNRGAGAPIQWAMTRMTFSTGPLPSKFSHPPRSRCSSDVCACNAHEMAETPSFFRPLPDLLAAGGGGTLKPCKLSRVSREQDATTAATVLAPLAVMLLTEGSVRHLMASHSRFRAVKRVVANDAASDRGNSVAVVY